VRQWLGEGSYEHRQVYGAWRAFPTAMALTAVVFFMLGAYVTAALAIALDKL